MQLITCVVIAWHWFSWSYRLSDLRQIKSETIRIERSADIETEMSFAKDILATIDPAQLLPKSEGSMVERYIIDLHAMLSETRNVLKTRRTRNRYVVGNSNIKGVFVSNSKALLKIAERISLSCVSNKERELPSNLTFICPHLIQILQA